MNSRTVYTVLEETAQGLANVAALQQPLGKGEYKTYTWGEYRRAVQEIACGLRALGVEKGENVAIYSETRAEFYLVDIGIMAAGAVAAALYTSYPLPDLVGNLRASDAGTVFVENPKSLRALIGASGEHGLQLRFILLTGEAQNAITLEALRAKGKETMEADPGRFEAIRREVSPTDPAVLYLTSGATGEPKMGIVTQAALVANADMGPAALRLTPADSTIVFLPSAHIAQRVVNEMVPLRLGVTVWFSESLSKLPNELKTIRPTFFLAPPRVWERIFTSISTEINKRGRISKKLLHGAVGLGAQAALLQQQGKPVPGWMNPALKLADRLVFSKIRERLGGRLRIAASGAAPLGKELAEFYGAIGLPLIEGYGLTEAGVVTLNPIDNPRFGSIGKPLEGIQVRLAEDGELMVKSPCLFTGYYKDPVSTASVLRDGWLATGDIAEIDPDGFVFIIGRKKELIVSSNGKKIYPTRIEGLFKTEPLINQMLLIGDKLPYVTALFTLNVANVESLKGMEEWKGRQQAEVIAAPPVVAELQKAVVRANKQLASFEQIRKFRVLERDFSIESGELTPTMKVRRTKVLENHRGLISELYMGKEEGK
ncbi:MAG: AMP-dependent synthetase/ligase [Bryobacteraceae bacterium]